MLARQIGVEYIVVALSKADAADGELAELVELEVRELLTRYGYPGDQVPVIRVSALGALADEPRWVASVGALLDAVDAYLPVPDRYVGAPFLMPVENVLTITGRGTVVTGAIERGQVRTGDAIEAVGLGVTVTSVVTGVETFGKTMEHAEAGDNAALLLRGVRRHQVRRGQVVAAPAAWPRTRSSRPACTCCPRPRAAAGPRCVPATGRSSSSGPPTWLACSTSGRAASPRRVTG